jgi:hypothetical protein
VTEAILNLKTAHERFRRGREAVAQARESLELIRLRYQSGLTILVDLLSAEDATKNAELSQVAARFDTYLAQAGSGPGLGTISGPVARVSRRGDPVARAASRRGDPVVARAWRSITPCPKGKPVGATRWVARLVVHRH